METPSSSTSRTWGCSVSKVSPFTANRMSMTMRSAMRMFSMSGSFASRLNHAGSRWVDIPRGFEEGQALDQMRAVDGIEWNQDVHVLGGADDAIQAHRVPAHQDVAHAPGLQSTADFKQVVLHAAETRPGVGVPCPHPWRRKRHGCHGRRHVAGSPASPAAVSWHPGGRHAPGLPGGWRRIPATGDCRRYACDLQTQSRCSKLSSLSGRDGQEPGDQPDRRHNAPQPDARGRRDACATCYTAPSITCSNTILPFSTSTRMMSLGAKWPDRISFASGFSICCWMARLSGRAP